MIPFFPKQIATKGIYIFLGTLAVVTLLYYRYAMSLEFIAFSTASVLSFFLLSCYCSRKWLDIEPKRFMRNVFLSALGLRVAWVFGAYVFFTVKTGMPFEFSAGDSLWYYEESVGNMYTPLADIWNYLFVDTGKISDSGYVFYLSLLAKVFGYSVLAPRLVNAVLSAAMCLLIYRLATRNIGEAGGRMATVFACFMPNLIFYCGLHLKEAVMLFLEVAFLERADYLLRSRKYNVVTIALPVAIAIVLFSFRTVIGIVCLFSIATALVFSSSKIIGWGKRLMLIGWGLLVVATFAGGVINSEISDTIEGSGTNQVNKRTLQAAKGVQWAKYATGTVMAPIMFVLPFPTMIDVDNQYTQQMLGGGNYVRNFMGGFVLLALFSAIFITKNWRDLTLIGSFVFAYLGILSMSGFANSERFLLPALPMLLIMAAYGITQLDAKNYRIVRLWFWIVPLMAVGWAFFKLGSRGML